MAHRAMQLTDWLDDLSVRFIVNLPREELESVERICFQVEEAQWFYEDFVRPLDPNLPSLNLRQFSMKIFQHCPLFSGYGADVHSKAFSEFLAYKTRVPVRGAILLNETMDQVILVKGWKKGANWSFPRGKINKDEKDIDCAIREVYEETGFDINAAGLNTGEENAKFIEVTMREQHMKLFVFAGIPMSTYFEPRTRKEISAIQWYKLSELPTLRKIKPGQENAAPVNINYNKFYMVAPFVKPLKRIITQLRKERASATQGTQFLDPAILNASLVPDSHVLTGTAGNDMTRLMAQLRQSSQASRESNYPEVSDPDDMARNGSQQLKNLLHLPSVSEEQQAAQQAATMRENKASAMLSLLRSGTSGSAPSPRVAPLPQTPYEQTFSNPTQAPPSPHHLHTVRTPRVPQLSTPPVFEVSPDHASEQRQIGRIGLEGQTSRIHVSPQEQQAMLPPFLRDPPGQQLYNNQPSAATAAPYRHTGDPQFAPIYPTDQEGPSAIPHASRLPPPKLTAHSSNLLNLFKSTTSPPPVPTSDPFRGPSMSSRPELSAPSPVIQTRPPHPALTSVPPPMSSSTPALATPGSETNSNESLKRSSQQETLLNLFRLAKPSPSLAPPLDPVELSAQGSPTSRRMVDGFRTERAVSASRGPVVIAKNTERAPLPSSGNVSATVSGPLNVPQFDKILRRPAEAKPVEQTSVPGPPTTVSVTQPVKILSRPSAGTKTNSVPRQQSPKPERSPRRPHKNRASSKEPPFQPQILKRPTATTAQEHHSPRSVPQNIPEDTGTPVTVSTASSTAPLAAPLLATVVPGQRATQTAEQKATLLSLFNSNPAPVTTTTTTTTQFPRRGSLVSPMSEKPASGLSSPLGVAGKSRVGSLQEMGGEGVQPPPPAGSVAPIVVPSPATPLDHNLPTPLGHGLPTPLGPSAPTPPQAPVPPPPPPTRSRSHESGVSSPVDRKFLLGFLDSVANQQRK